MVVADKRVQIKASRKVVGFNRCRLSGSTRSHAKADVFIDTEKLEDIQKSVIIPSFDFHSTKN